MTVFVIVAAEKSTQIVLKIHLTPLAVIPVCLVTLKALVTCQCPLSGTVRWKTTTLRMAVSATVELMIPTAIWICSLLNPTTIVMESVLLEYVLQTTL